MFTAIATAIFIEAMPFLVLGALFSAVIEVFVSEERLLKCIPRNVAGGLAVGIGAGFLLPTCECGVVPIVRRLMRKGVPPYISIAYMLAAPIVNPVVLASTFLAFRGSIPMVAGRVALAVIVASAVGLYARTLPDVLANGRNDEGHEHNHEGQSLAEKLHAVMLHTASEFMDMGKFLIFGAFAAAAFKTLLPAGIMSLFSENLLLAIAAMMILAILSVCSEADAFVAASFHTFPAAAHLAFVAIGPMVDLKLIGMYMICFNRRLVFALIFVPILLIFTLTYLSGQLGFLEGVQL